MLTEKELQQIREEAEKLYPPPQNEGEGFERYFQTMTRIRQYQRDTHIAALTRERERVKGLEESVKKLAQATSNLIQDIRNKPNDTRYATHTKAALVALDEYLTVFKNYKNNK